MDIDHGRIHLIEIESALLASRINWLELHHVKDIRSNSWPSGSITAKIFCDWPDLLNELMFSDGELLIHNNYQMVDAKVHVRVYYTDAREFYDQRFIYLFHDQTVDILKVNSVMEQEERRQVEWTIEI